MDDYVSSQSSTQAESSPPPQDMDEIEQNIVEPLILKKQRGIGCKRGRALRDVLQGAYAALWAMGNGSFLSRQQQKAVWPYVTWPPIPQWHILQFDDKAASTSVKYTVEPEDHAAKQALAGIFQPKRRVHPGQLYYKHLLIPIFFRHQENGADVCMWGVVHVQKGRNVADFHVLTKWQEDVHGANIRAWAKSFDPRGLFGGPSKGFNLKIVVQAHDVTLDTQAFRRQNDLEHWGKATFFYSIHVVRHLMLLGASGNRIPRFSLEKNGPEGVVQLLVGINTAFEHAGLLITRGRPACEMEKDEENAVIYRKVCQDIRNAFEEDDGDASVVSKGGSSDEDLDGVTIVDDTNLHCITCDEGQDEEMA